MKIVSVAHLSVVLALLLGTGCQGDAGISPGSSRPVSGVPQSCERSCNAEYDACMDRFSGVSGGAGLGRHGDDATASLGPNDICPDQLKSCNRRCLP